VYSIRKEVSDTAVGMNVKAVTQITTNNHSLILALGNKYKTEMLYSKI
jgi:hypothetical protein